MQNFLESLKSISNQAFKWAGRRKLLIAVVLIGIRAAFIENWFLFGACIFGVIVLLLGYAINDDLKAAAEKHAQERAAAEEQAIAEKQRELRRLELDLDVLKAQTKLDAIIATEEAQQAADDLKRLYPRRPHQRGIRKDRYKPLPPYMASLVPEDPIKGAGRKVAGIVYHKTKFRKLLGPIPEDQESNQLDTHALLVVAPDNPYDEYAVAVFVQGLHIGYLPADRARTWARTLDSLEGQGFHLEVPIKIKQVTNPRPGPRAAIKIPDHDLFVGGAQYQDLFDDEAAEAHDNRDDAE